jgi:hypothetical protein
MIIMKEKELNEKIEQGYLKIRVIFEIIGKPKEHIEQTMKAYLENVKAENGIITLHSEVEAGEELEDDMFGVVGEVELLVPSIDKLSWLAINFSPASIEVIEPEKIIFQQKDINHWANDFLAKLHEIGILQKSAKSQQEGLIRNFNAMTRNAIILCLNEPRDEEYLAKKIGMNIEHTQKFLEALIKEKRIIKEKNKYKIAT